MRASRAVPHAAVRAHFEDHLASLVAWRNKVGEHHAERDAAWLAEKAGVAATLGLIDTTEATRWESPARWLGRPWPRTGEARAARRRAEAHLRRFVDRIDEVLASPRRAERSAAFHGAVLAYKSVGLLTREQALRWQNRLWSAEYRAERRPRDPPPFAARGVPRLMPGPDRRVGGLRVNALAIYDDGFVATCHVDPAGAARHDPVDIPTFLDLDDHSPFQGATVTDDRGTTYSRTSASWQRVGYAVRNVTIGMATFAPAPPVGARRLRVAARGEAMTMRLPGR